ncbi:MAG: glycosyltransferase family 4 protein [Rectinemataceae bacterium]
MKIAWITRAAAYTGGAERHIADVVSLLAERGASNYLLYELDAPMDSAFVSLFSGAFPQVELARQLEFLAPDVIYVHQVSGRRTLEVLADTGIPSLRFFHDHAPFCLHVHKYTTIGHRSCSRVLGPYCSFPCLGPVNRRSGFPPVSLRTLGAARAELRANMRLNACAVGSVHMKDHLVAHGFPPAAVRVLPMFTKLPDQDPPVERERGLLLFVGALLRGKGLDVLLSALARLGPECRLRVAGSGHQEGMFREQAARLGVAERVEFLGRIGRSELDTQYRAASCVVVPSREPETFGLVGLEAFRHATPVVASRVGGIGDWLLEGKTGYGFPSGDAEGLAAVLRRLLDDPVAALATGRAGRELLLACFTPERHATALMDLLGIVIRSRGQS